LWVAESLVLNLQNEIASAETVNELNTEMNDGKKKWHYLGVFCKCGAFQPLWKHPERHLVVHLPSTWSLQLVCQSCGESFLFDSDTPVALVSSDKHCVRFRSSMK